MDAKFEHGGWKIDTLVDHICVPCLVQLGESGEKESHGIVFNTQDKMMSIYNVEVVDPSECDNKDNGCSAQATE